MKLLIGILILLFVLTTVGFYDVAYAATACERTFEELTPEREYEALELEYYNHMRRNSHFLETRQRDQFNPQDDFSNHQYESWDHYNINF